MTGFAAFDGELDPVTPSQAPGVKLVPFDGELDAPRLSAGGGRGFVNPPAVEPSKPVPAMQDDTPAADPMGTGDAQAIIGSAIKAPATLPPSAAGAGRGEVNPPLASEPQPERVNMREVGMGEGMLRDMRLAQYGLSKTFGAAMAAIPMMAEEVFSAAGSQYFGMEPSTAVTDAAFGALVEPAAKVKEADEFKPGENRSALNRVMGGLTAMITTDLPAMVMSGGESEAPTIARAAQPVVEFVGQALEHGLRASRPVMLRAAEEKADQVLKAGGDERQAAISGLTAAMSTAVQNSVAMSVPGKLATRAGGGAIVGAAMGEGARAAQNIADPDALHRDFDPTDVAVNAATGAILAGAMGERAAPQRLDRIDLGYDPLAGKTPVAQAVQELVHTPVAKVVEPARAEPAASVGEIFRADTVADAAAAAQRAVAALDSARPVRPLATEAQGLPNERISADVPAVPPGAGEPGRADAAPGVDPVVGDRGDAIPAVDAAGTGRAPEAAAARVEPDAPVLPAIGTRPYSEPERVEAQRHVERLNSALGITNADRTGRGVETDAPAVVLTTAPSPDMVLGRMVGRVLGVPVVFIAPHDGFNGVHYDGVAYVSPNESHPVLAISGHEVLHGLLQGMQPRQRQEFMDTVAPYLRPEAIAKKREMEPTRGEAHATEEVVADLNGSMWLDPKFWQAVREHDPDVFRQLVYRFMQMVATVKSKLSAVSRFQADRFTEDVDRVRDLLAQETARLAQEEGIGAFRPTEKVELGLRKPADQAAGADGQRQRAPDKPESAAQRNPLLDWLSVNGVSSALRSEFAPGRTEQRSAMGRGGPIFRGAGLSLDALAERAWQDGYLPSADAHAMYDLMARAMGGERIAPLYQHEQAEAEMQRRVDQRQALEEDARSLELTPDELESTGYSDADPQVQGRVKELLAQAEAAGVDGESILEQVALVNENGSDHDYLNAAQAALEAAVSRAGEAGARDRGEGAGRQGAGQAPQEAALDLLGRAPSDSLQQASRMRGDREERDRTAQQAAPDAGEFRLTGSARAADEAAARGQGAMFDRKDEPARKPGTITRDEARQLGDLRKKAKLLESIRECLG